MFDSMALSEISDRSIAVMVGISQFFLPCLFFSFVFGFWLLQLKTRYRV